MSLGPLEIAVIVILFILLFGAKKLPDAARALGRSMRIFKSEVKEMSNDDKRFEEQQRAIEAQPIVPNPAPSPIIDAQPVQPQQPVQNPGQQPQA
ncbi:Sec-independent protein translocase subunit TatA [Corynebacterium felinum]|uniref:Sec-independent protein translocase protein TatA n=1 Tax=Corynebacterium felinum TaxID=131318 RepID=A0ABU2BAL0_9CORY|nr:MULTISPECIES: Sec-independent protein translocase subunit TatA [Corynebacterium]MDF5819992.1 Sec-independent protein translocase subunit TatA [Corynebacterium felinum]MDO4762727.1 Sec-independent protein translocase subunit TatA [Corynebacterium sp.]MDR7355651.1 sec-independent protein translocase protein TatA [Corynebacterium felinum]WJY95002.1 Sec-independent protein translocase protein TatAy [Corynebacterium felinum]